MTHNKDIQYGADGIEFDKAGNLYVGNFGDGAVHKITFDADFCANAVAKAAPNGKVTRIAQRPDSDVLEGELDQPGEPIIWRGKMILSCFDLVTGPQMVNTKHEMPATLPELEPC